MTSYKLISWGVGVAGLGREVEEGYVRGVEGRGRRGGGDRMRCLPGRTSGNAFPFLLLCVSVVA